MPLSSNSKIWMGLQARCDWVGKVQSTFNRESAIIFGICGFRKIFLDECFAIVNMLDPKRHCIVFLSLYDVQTCV
jgi:hypothetical protein